MIIDSLPGKENKKQYINISFFAKGGMGEIYKAYDEVNKHDVAIKLIAILDPSDEELLRREVNVSSELESEYIVETHFTGKASIGGNNYLYIVQSFYEAGNLRSLIKAGIKIEQCFFMMNDLLKGLNVAHSKIVHRDLKPENILINSSGSLVITDFGLAKYIDVKTRSRSFKGAGTIPYMAPECWLMEENTVIMDIYSLGIIFYEILTGELPFNSSLESEWRDFHLYSQMPEVSKSRNDVTVKLEQIISKMTQKRTQDRYQSVEQIISAIQEALNQSKSSQKEIERLAAMGHGTIQQIESDKLRQKQEKGKIEEYKKLLNFHITELFSNVIQLATQVNESLESQKIIIDEKAYNGNLTNRTLSLGFGGVKRIRFEFCDYDHIEIYEKDRKDRILQSQKQRHGFVTSGARDSIFTKNNIVLIGKVESNFQNPILQECFGYNLALVKKESDLYGKWFIASFSDSGFSRTNRKEFALEFDDFLYEFEKCFAMHVLSVTYREIQDSDLSRAIEEILKP